VNVQRQLDDLYAGRRKLVSGPARTAELMRLLSPESRRAVAAGLAMCPWARRTVL
jgi:hypothetical protein